MRTTSRWSRGRAPRTAALAGLAALACLAGSAAAEPQGLRVVYRADGLPAGPDDARWQELPQTQVELSPQIIVPPKGGGGVASLSLRAAHDGERIAFLLAWRDPTPNREVGVASFRDAAALGFPALASATAPSPFMGDADHPVNIWQWSAELEAEARGEGSFATRYPHTPGVWYFPQDASVTRQVRAWRGVAPVMEFVAHGYGTLRPRPVRNVLASGRWADGTWKVVMRRALETGDPEDAVFRPSEPQNLIAAVWEGSAGDVNGRKSVTLTWIPVQLDSTVVADGDR